MAIKLVDELKAMGNFPIAHAEGINLVKTDGTEDNLQNLFDNGELGGGDDSVTLTQEEYEALSEEQKLDGLYYTYDTKRIYKNGIQYGASEPIPLTMEEYKALKEAGAIDEQQEYLIEADEQGTLLGAVDIGYNNAESGIQATTVQGAIDKIAETRGNVYSTEETIVGTWIDGKPIYRKTINFGPLPNNNIKKVSHSILNIDAFVSINGITFTSEKTATALPYAHSDSTNEVSLFIEGTNVAIRTFGNKTNYIKTYVILEYTKTTD